MKRILSVFRGWGLIGYLALALLAGAVAMEILSWV
ncbi:hypothetical protein ABID21_004601 [Pseudorhizobium tarimense]|uniref:Uncharacterized protein n=1 Tax=Pseudorhizobium tarimense TaxID=1079109 RepID=A0ABV2HD34_9HYPH